MRAKAVQHWDSVVLLAEQEKILYMKKSIEQ